jgi:lambda family phage portal protein
MVDRTTENVIGPKGFQLQPTSNNPAWTPEKNKAWNKQAKALMEGWFPTADIAGMDWVTHQKTILQAVLVDGDVGIMLDKDGFLQGVESDLIADPDKEAKQEAINTIHFGIEIDDYLKPVAFWVNTLPTDEEIGSGEESKSVRVAAKDFVFVARLNRFGQLRGETTFATIFDLIDQISQWKYATLMAARVAACFGVAITKANKAPIFNAANGNVNAAGQNVASVNLEPGSIQYLDPGDSIETINPAQPGHNFPQNLTALIRMAGIPFGLPLELLLLDFSKTSYVSTRAAMLQAQNKFEDWQNFFINNYLKRIYRWRISKFIKDGLLEENADAFNHRWIGNRWSYLDPIKEYQALSMAQSIGIETLTDQLQAEGRTLEDYIASRQNEIKLLTEAGIPLLHSQALMQFQDFGPANTANTANANPSNTANTANANPSNTANTANANPSNTADLSGMTPDDEYESEPETTEETEDNENE